LTALEDRLRTLRHRFVEAAAADADTVEAQAAAMNWLAVRDISHSIAGRAGMFGFSALSDTARSLEIAVDAGDAPERLLILGSALVAALRDLPIGD
jgi:HPt (histidine-containing phosphotransfer) domain-containing protein